MNEQASMSRAKKQQKMDQYARNRKDRRMDIYEKEEKKKEFF